MKYEYKVLKIASMILFKSKDDPTINSDKTEDFESALNELGKEGWELIEIIDPRGFMGLGDSGQCIFKRIVK